MFERLKKKLCDLCCCRNVYTGLGGCHGFAAWATQKPEVYVPMALMYLILAFVSEH